MSAKKQSNKKVNIKTDKANIAVGKKNVEIKAKGKQKIKVPTKVAVTLVAIVLVVAIVTVACYYLIAPFKLYIDNILGIRSINPANGELNVHFVDIGQGDFIIVQLPDGKNMVIDAGSDGAGNKQISGKDIVKNKINDLGITTFDYMLLTHTDSDHIDYMDDILAQCKVLNIYRPMFLSKTEKASGESKFATVDTVVYDEFITAVSQEVATENAQVFMNNDKVEPITGEGYRIDFYNVNESAYYASTVGNTIDAYEKNAVSPITILTYMGESIERSIAFTGDAEGKVDGNGNGAEQQFIEKYKINKFDIDVLKAGHHGSKPSASVEFLDFLDPEYCVVSVGTTGKHGHPTPAFIDRVTNWKDKNTKDDNDNILGLYMTKNEGDILLNINKASVLKWTFELGAAA